MCEPWIFFTAFKDFYKGWITFDNPGKEFKKKFRFFVLYSFLRQGFIMHFWLSQPLEGWDYRCAPPRPVQLQVKSKVNASKPVTEWDRIWTTIFMHVTGLIPTLRNSAPSSENSSASHLDFWESPGKSIHRHSGHGSQKWQITVTVLSSRSCLWIRWKIVHSAATSWVCAQPAIPPQSRLKRLQSWKAPLFLPFCLLLFFVPLQASSLIFCCLSFGHAKLHLSPLTVRANKLLGMMTDSEKSSLPQKISHFQRQKHPKRRTVSHVHTDSGLVGSILSECFLLYYQWI